MTLLTPEFEQRRAEVAECIRTAFSGDETPPDPPVMSPDRNDSFYRSLEAPFQALMAQPTAEGLIEHGHVARHLKPSAERWFWRAHLLAALEAPWDHVHDYQTQSLVHSTTYWLRPNPCAIRAGRTDYEDAQNLRQRFTPEQRIAVSRFLGFVLTAPTIAGSIYAYGASQSIAWCWTDHPATAKASQDLRNSGRAYQRPPADNGVFEDLIHAIESAFAHTPPPDGPLMGAQDEEPSSYAIEFRGAQWQSLTPWFVDFHSTAFSFMTPAAFRYFLPAVMCHELGPGSEVDLGFHLVQCVLEPSSYRDDTRARILTFTSEERRVICDFLAWEGYSEEGMPPGYDEAIVDFWDPDTGLQAGGEGG
ncbi:MAG: DUF6714 family protein [Myxococcota bacterium]